MRIIFILIVVLSFLNGCEEHVHGPNEHFQPEGWVFSDESGNKFMQIFKGQYREGSNTEFIAPLNELSELISVKFLDEHGDEIEAPDEADYIFDRLVSDSSVAEVYLDSESKWKFQLKGKRRDTSSVQFFVNHGEHTDVHSGLLKIRVE